MNDIGRVGLIWYCALIACLGLFLMFLAMYNNQEHEALNLSVFMESPYALLGLFAFVLAVVTMVQLTFEL